MRWPAGFVMLRWRCPHALDLRRVDGTRFRVVIFTNLGHDHLDHHGDMEQYFRAKARLFTPAFTDLAVINVDDPYGQRLADDVEAMQVEGRQPVRVIRVSIADAADLHLDGPVATFTWRGLPVALHLAGRYNVSNALGAATAAEAVGCDPIDIADALCAAEPPAAVSSWSTSGSRSKWPSTTPTPPTR